MNPVIRQGMESLRTWMRKSVTAVGDDADKVVARKLLDDGKAAVPSSGEKALKLVKTSEFRPLKAKRIQLHPEVAAAWKQSKINASRYKEETLQILTEKLGSRAKAEAKYDALIKHFKKNQYIAANYTNLSFTNALKKGKVRSLYDLPLKTQIDSKGVAYVAGRVLFSDGNHNYVAKRLNARKAFEESRFTYVDVPPLTVNRIVRENLDPKEASKLIEGLVYGGIDPRKTAESITILRPAEGLEALLKAAETHGIPLKQGG